MRKREISDASALFGREADEPHYLGHRDALHGQPVVHHQRHRKDRLHLRLIPARERTASIDRFHLGRRDDLLLAVLVGYAAGVMTGWLW